MTELRGIQGGIEADPAAGVVAAIEELAAGRLVVLVDERADSAYLLASGTIATTNAMVTMATYGRGVLKVAMPPARLAELGVAAIGGCDGDGYHVPVDLIGHDRPGNHAGRAATVRALADPATMASTLGSPGHVFPVCADAQGTLARVGVPEAAADLARIASRVAVAAYSGAVDEGGAPADRAAAGRLARTLGLNIVSVEEVAAYRERVEPAVERLVVADLPTREGPLTAVAFRSLRCEREYTAFVRGEPERRGVRVHIHFGCQPSDVFGGTACGCGDALRGALDEIAAAGHGVVIHTEHPHPFRHIGDGGGPTPSVEVDVAHLLRQLDVREPRVSCNEPLDLERLGASGMRGLGRELAPAHADLAAQQLAGRRAG
jgi:3,4-dihydroxy 2-butanone 4-phosphate synthase/GTP cyclohydrolase II